MFDKLKIIISLFLSICSTNLAMAQTAPNNIDDRFRAQNMFATESDMQNALLTGNSDIILLRRSKLLTLMASTSATQTDNAALTPFDTENDFIGNGQITVRLGTKIANKFNVFADIGAIGARYKKNANLDYSALVGAVGVQTVHKGVDFSLTHQPSIIFDRGFKKRQLRQARTGIKIARPLVVKGFYINPSIHYERVVSNPKDYNNWGYGSEISITKRLLRNKPLYANVEYSFERRQYDSYFADFLGTERNDRHKTLSIGLRYDITDNINLNLNYEQTRNFSTSDVNEYKATNKVIGLSLGVRF